MSTISHYNGEPFREGYYSATSALEALSTTLTEEQRALLVKLINGIFQAAEAIHTVPNGSIIEGSGSSTDWETDAAALANIAGLVAIQTAK